VLLGRGRFKVVVWRRFQLLFTRLILLILLLLRLNNDGFFPGGQWLVNLKSVDAENVAANVQELELANLII